MSERYKEIFKLDSSLWNEGKQDIIDEIYAENFVNHDPSRPDVVDRKGFKNWIAEVRTSMPDHKNVVEDMIIEGDMVASRWVCTGTHLGAYGNILPTGKQAKYSGMSFYRMENDKIAEAWWLYDTFGVMQQLGVLPSMEEA
jgi:steroid delta-isomerase-like uncharacterized protein